MFTCAITIKYIGVENSIYTLNAEAIDSFNTGTKKLTA